MRYSILIGMILAFSMPQKDDLPNQEQIDILMERHNFWRADVGVEPMEWSDELARSALKWAKELKNDDCGFYHSSGKYGENIWMGTSGYYTAADVVDSWASEKAFYNYKTNKCKSGEACGHYTQIVWRNTKRVGCAMVECNGMTTWVCQYDPPGNWVGEKPY